jgi:hypothetical protein
VNKVKGLYGAQFEKSRACGYCHYHKKHLTVKMVKAHQCLSKQCDALQKYEHEWWHQRDLMKQRKKANKQINDLLV